MTFSTYSEFVQELRRQMSKPFNFIVPKVKAKELKVIDICCKYDGRTQWVSFPLVLDEQQIKFIVHAFQE